MRSKVSLFVVFCLLFFSMAACGPPDSEEQNSGQGEQGGNNGVGEEADDTQEPTHTPTSAPPINPVDQNIYEATVFQTDFEEGVPPGIDDWESNWETQQDGDNTVYCNSSTQEWTDFTFGSPYLENYAFEARVKFVRGYSSAGFVMMFRIADGSAYAINVSHSHANFSFMNPWRNLSDSEVNIINEEWHTYRVEAINQILNFYIDDELITTANDSEITSGPAGIAATGNAAICVDDLRLWTIDQDGPVVMDNLPGWMYVNNIPQSEYFDNVELLESTMVPLVPIGEDIHTIRIADMFDMDADGVDDVVLQIATYSEMGFHPLVILNGDGPVENLAGQLFPNGVLEIVNANQMIFADINDDGLEDLLVSEAGLDRPPWYLPEARIGIALNNGDGTWEDVSDTVPEEAIGLRNYSFAVGDLYTDGVTRILLPSQVITDTINGPLLTGLLFWNGSEFEFQQNWIDMNLWWGYENLYSSSFMLVKDLDGDGWMDLYMGGNQTNPNNRVLFGGENFPSADSLYVLPDGPYGHEPWDNLMQPGVDSIRGADMNRAVIEDFDGDGDLDIVTLAEETIATNVPGGGEPEVTYGDIWFQVLRNDGNRQFTDVEEQGRDMGYRYYISLFSIDIDLDGDLDLIGHYYTKEIVRPQESCVPVWGTTFLINEGDLVFTTVEIEDVFPELALEAQFPSDAAAFGPTGAECAVMGWGAFFPTQITESGIKGLFVAPVEYDVQNPRLRVLRIYASGVFQMP